MSSNASADGGTQPSGVVEAGSKSEGPPSKRRRVALACNACRIRKSRCNGERPKCSLCENLGFDCTYEPTESSTNVIVKKEYVSDFEARLKTVEETLKRHDDLLVGHLSSYSTRSGVPPTSPQRNDVIRSTPARESIQMNASELQDVPAEEAVTDGMAMSFMDEFDSVFFGPSSNIAFTRSILQAMQSRNINQPKTFRSHDKRSVLDGGILDYSRPASPTSPDEPSLSPAAMFELPPVSELETLLEIFFRNTGLLFPFIHEPTFMETYRTFRASKFTSVRRTWAGLLNIVLAMGSSMDPGTTKNAVSRAQKSSVFYQRAVKLCSKSSIKGASLEVVQYLLLASQYLQGTQKSSQTWTLHGLAVKGAFALGLHSNQSSQRFSPLENEIRKRSWFGCVLLDRVCIPGSTSEMAANDCFLNQVLSMTFGRPPNIPEDYVRLPLAQYWPEHTGFANPELQTPSTDFFNASITLHRCIGLAITRLYGQNLGYDAVLAEAELTPRIFELEEELGRWRSSLPSELRIVSSTTLPTPTIHRGRVVDRFRTMLTLRYHNLSILVHRPLLCQSLDILAETLPEVWPSSTSQITKACIDACLGSAEETINIVHGILTDPSLGASVLGAWWFTLYYLFNASLVVFANSLIQRSTLQQAPNSFQQTQQDIEHLKRAIDAFRLLDRDNRILDRCTEYIEYLLKVIEQQQPGVMPLTTGMNEFGANGNLPDLNDFLKDDLELAQFFASGIFDMQSSSDGII